MNLSSILSVCSFVVVWVHVRASIRPCLESARNGDESEKDTENAALISLCAGVCRYEMEHFSYLYIPADQSQKLLL